MSDSPPRLNDERISAQPILSRQAFVVELDQSPSNAFQPEIIQLMGTVCDEAWRGLIATTLFSSAKVEAEIRRRMCTAVIIAVGKGERDAVKLREVALAAVDE
jgi:hypothetical protein